MTEKLSITINGLEYVAKAATQSIELEQNAIKINRLEDEIHNLKISLDLALENSAKKDILIKCLERAVSALEEENNENDSVINELRSSLDDIEHVLSRTH